LTALSDGHTTTNGADLGWSLHWQGEHMFDTVSQVMNFFGDHEIEHLRRSLAMLPAGADALNREEAMALLGRLRDAMARLRRIEAGLEALLSAELRPGVPQSEP
jgi:hypothetical protein